jgi:uncharacterized HAD superfamily protein
MFAIEIKTKPNTNGNTPRLYIVMNEKGFHEQITEERPQGMAVTQSFQVTPKEFKHWKELYKLRKQVGYKC